MDYQADRTSPFPHMLPRAADFSLLMRALHIGSTDTIVLYDASSAYCAAARVWFTFLAMSHPPQLLRLLDGGFQGWVQSFRHLTQSSPSPSTPASLPPPQHPAPASPYTAALIPSLLWTQQRILSALSSDSPPLILDARDPARFDGRDPEPRPARRRGHIPHAVNLWHVDLQTVLTEGRQGFKPRHELLRILKEKGISSTEQDERETVCLCGSGITACTDLFVLHELGFRRLGLYDESMCQWLNADELPLA